MLKCMTSILVLCICSLLCVSIAYGQARYTKFSLHISVSNRTELLSERNATSVNLNFQNTSLPSKTSLVLSMKRKYPSLLKKDGFDTLDILRSQKRLSRIQAEGSRLSLVTFGDRPPAVGHYTIDIGIGLSQHRTVRNELGDARDHLSETLLVFVGAKSLAYEEIQTEIKLFLEKTTKYLETYNQRFGYRIVIAQDGTITKEPQTPKDPKEIMKEIQVLGFGILNRKASFVMPECVDLLDNVRAQMLELLGPGLGPRPIEMERVVSMLQWMFLRIAILNLNYYVNDDYNRMDKVFEDLVKNPNIQLQSRMQEEWKKSHDAALATWELIQGKYFTETYLNTNQALRSLGSLHDSQYQVEADCIAFRKLVMKESFRESVTEYLAVANELQLAFSVRLENEMDTANTAKIRSLKRKISELDQTLRQRLRITGVIDLDEEEDSLDDSDSPEEN